MKKSILLVFLLFSTISFVSAQGLGELLNNIDQSTILLFAIFILSFSLLFFALNKAFKKQNTAISGIISVVIAFLIVYGINKSGFNIEGSLSDIGISPEMLGIVIPLVIIAGIIFLVIRLKENSLLAIGGLLILVSFFVDAKLLLILVGVILILVRFFIAYGKKKKGYNDKGAGI